ncbi:hypothetical protein PVK06_001605 [Gossypium arboreum]|uniref:Uncharacterized protein n=1 Tax=Gossypium arboreum TaxID=29729 RepID=A0ABR0R2H5_GOSAR|nr:hypothetical protein PVK06_001605 [Gossypium arboreum]
MTKAQEQQALYWSYVKDQDIALKRSLEKNFTKPMPKFPDFPKDLLPFLEARSVEEEPIEVSSNRAKPATMRENLEKGKTAKKEPEKTKFVNTEGEKEEQNETTLTPTPQKDSTEAVPHPPTKSMFEQDREIHRIIEEITKSDKEEEEPPIQSLKRKLRYKCIAGKSTSKN